MPRSRFRLRYLLEDALAFVAILSGAFSVLLAVNVGISLYQNNGNEEITAVLALVFFSIAAAATLGSYCLRRQEVARIQITIRSMLLATFWLAVCCAGWTIAARTESWSIVFSHDISWFGIAGAVVGFVCPYVAIGALLGRTWLGAAFGILLLVPTNVVVMVMGIVIYGAL